MIRYALSVLAMLGLTFAVVTPAVADTSRVKEFNFEDDLIEGELASANFLDVRTLGDGELMSLIQIRNHFTDKMLVDVDNLP